MSQNLYKAEYFQTDLKLRIFFNVLCICFIESHGQDRTGITDDNVDVVDTDSGSGEEEGYSVQVQVDVSKNKKMLSENSKTLSKEFLASFIKNITDKSKKEIIQKLRRQRAKINILPVVTVNATDSDNSEASSSMNECDGKGCQEFNENKVKQFKGGQNRQEDDDMDKEDNEDTDKLDNQDNSDKNDPENNFNVAEYKTGEAKSRYKIENDFKDFKKEQSGDIEKDKSNTPGSLFVNWNETTDRQNGTLTNDKLDKILSIIIHEQKKENVDKITERNNTTEAPVQDNTTEAPVQDDDGEALDEDELQEGTVDVPEPSEVETKEQSKTTKENKEEPIKQQTDKIKENEDELRQQTKKMKEKKKGREKEIKEESKIAHKNKEELKQQIKAKEQNEQENKKQNKKIKEKLGINVSDAKKQKGKKVLSAPTIKSLISAGMLVNNTESGSGADTEDDEEEEEEEDEEGEEEDVTSNNVNKNKPSTMTGRTLTISFQENADQLGNKETDDAQSAARLTGTMEEHDKETKTEEHQEKEEKQTTVDKFKNIHQTVDKLRTDKQDNNNLLLPSGLVKPSKLFNDSVFEEAGRKASYPSEGRKTPDSNAEKRSPPASSNRTFESGDVDEYTSTLDRKIHSDVNDAQGAHGDMEDTSYFIKYSIPKDNFVSGKRNLILPQNVTKRHRLHKRSIMKEVLETNAESVPKLIQSYLNRRSLKENTTLFEIKKRNELALGQYSKRDKTIDRNKWFPGFSRADPTVMNQFTSLIFKRHQMYNSSANTNYGADGANDVSNVSSVKSLVKRDAVLDQLKPTYKEPKIKKKMTIPGVYVESIADIAEIAKPYQKQTQKSTVSHGKKDQKKISKHLISKRAVTEFSVKPAKLHRSKHNTSDRKGSILHVKKSLNMRGDKRLKIPFLDGYDDEPNGSKAELEALYKHGTEANSQTSAIFGAAMDKWTPQEERSTEQVLGTRDNTWASPLSIFESPILSNSNSGMNGVGSNQPMSMVDNGMLATPSDQPITRKEEKEAQEELLHYQSELMNKKNIEDSEYGKEDLEASIIKASEKDNLANDPEAEKTPYKMPGHSEQEKQFNEFQIQNNNEKPLNKQMELARGELNGRNRYMDRMDKPIQNILSSPKHKNETTGSKVNTTSIKNVEKSLAGVVHEETKKENEKLLDDDEDSTLTKRNIIKKELTRRLRYMLGYNRHSLSSHINNVIKRFITARRSDLEPRNSNMHTNDKSANTIMTENVALSNVPNIPGVTAEEGDRKINREFLGDDIDTGTIVDDLKKRNQRERGDVAMYEGLDNSKRFFH